MNGIGAREMRSERRRMSKESEKIMRMSKDVGKIMNGMRSEYARRAQDV